MTDDQRQALEDELIKDPKGIGYDVTGINKGLDAAIAILLNTRTPLVQIPRADILEEEWVPLVSLFDMVPNLQPEQIAYYTKLKTLRLKDENGQDTNILKALSVIFKNDDGTLTRIQALASRDGSPMEGLFGAGSAATDKDVALALRG